MNELDDDVLLAASLDREVVDVDVFIRPVVVTGRDHLRQAPPVVDDDAVAVLRQLLDRLAGVHDQLGNLLDEAFALGSRETVDVLVRPALLAHGGDQRGDDAHEDAQRAHQRGNVLLGHTGLLGFTHLSPCEIAGPQVGSS